MTACFILASLSEDAKRVYVLSALSRRVLLGVLAAPCRSETEKAFRQPVNPGPAPSAAFSTLSRAIIAPPSCGV